MHSFFKSSKRVVMPLMKSSAHFSSEESVPQETPLVLKAIMGGAALLVGYAGYIMVTDHLHRNKTKSLANQTIQKESMESLEQRMSASRLESERFKQLLLDDAKEDALFEARWQKTSQEIKRMTGENAYEESPSSGPTPH